MPQYLDILAKALIVLVPPTLIAFIALLLLMPSFPLDPDDLATVSGFYGPGSTTAWLVLVFSNTEMSLSHRLLWSATKGLISRTPGNELAQTLGKDLARLGFDATMLGTMAFSIVAFVDLIVQTARNAPPDPSGSQNSPSSYATIQAQLAVMHLTSAICVLAALSHLCYWTATILVEESEFDLVNLPEFTKMRRERKLRFWLWVALFVMAQLGMSLYCSLMESRRLADLQRQVSWAVPGTAFVVWAMDEKGWVKRVGKIVVGFVLLAWRMSMRGMVGDKVPVGFAWPRSAARMSDLDQAAAVVVALATLVLPWVKYGLTGWKAEEGGGVGNEEDENRSVTIVDGGNFAVDVVQGRDAVGVQEEDVTKCQ